MHPTFVIPRGVKRNEESQSSALGRDPSFHFAQDDTMGHLQK